MIKFKEPKNRLQFFSLHPKLMKIISDVAWYAKEHFNIDITITSMIRPGDLGVHGDNRGCDIRSWDFTKEQIGEIKYKFNTDYPYGDGKHPTCLVHDTGQGIHFHFQVKRDGKS